MKFRPVKRLPFWWTHTDQSQIWTVLLQFHPDLAGSGPDLDRSALRKIHPPTFSRSLQIWTRTGQIWSDHQNWNRTGHIWVKSGVSTWVHSNYQSLISLCFNFSFIPILLFKVVFSLPSLACLHLQIWARKAIFVPYCLHIQKLWVFQNVVAILLCLPQFCTFPSRERTNFRSWLDLFGEYISKFGSSNFRTIPNNSELILMWNPFSSD